MSIARNIANLYTANHQQWTRRLLSHELSPLHPKRSNSSAITVRFVGNPRDKAGKRETAGEMDLIELFGSKEAEERARQRERERGRERVVTSCSRDSTTHVAAKSYKTGISRVPLQAGRITRLVSSRLSAIVDALQLAATRLVDHSNLNDLSRGWIRPRRISRDLNINFGAGLWPRGDN